MKHLNYRVLIIPCLLLLGGVLGFVSYKTILCSKRIHRLEQRLETNDALTAQAFADTRNCTLDSAQHNVLCLGNSITLHQPLASVNWASRQGMAASQPENDYCHILQRLMQSHNKATTITPLNIASWERNFSIDKDSLLAKACTGKDIIIIRLGENVPFEQTPNFQSALNDLINYCKTYTPNIVLTGQYWTDPDKEAAVINNARNHSLKYIPIHWIWDSYRTECSPKEGDILLDTLGNEYPIKGNFILTHPNDAGMHKIATAIYNAL